MKDADTPEKLPKTKKVRNYTVGIGAWAGGIEALKTFSRICRQRTGICRDPASFTQHESILAAILKRKRRWRSRSERDVKVVRNHFMDSAE